MLRNREGIARCAMNASLKKFSMCQTAASEENLCDYAGKLLLII